MRAFISTPKQRAARVPGSKVSRRRRRRGGRFLLAPVVRRRSTDQPIAWHEPGPDLSGGSPVVAAFLAENPATEGDLGWLAAELGCELWVLQDLEVGYWPDADIFLVPERNHHGEIVGLQRLYRDGAKSVVRGSKRGLILPAVWEPEGDLIFIVAGVSNVAALRSVGANVIGVPAVRSTHKACASLLALLTESMNDVVVVADAGEEAENVATRLASEIQKRVGCRAAWAMPSHGFETVAEQINAGEWEPCLAFEDIFQD